MCAGDARDQEMIVGHPAFIWAVIKEHRIQKKNFTRSWQNL